MHIKGRHIIKISLSLLIGCFFLWLALRQIDILEIQNLISKIKIEWIFFALLFYMGAITLRISRWHKIIIPIAPLKFFEVAKALIVGYAVNNILPARMGELFRADYCKRQYGVSRVQILGTIVIERLIDSIVVIGTLALGLMMLYEKWHLEHQQSIIGLIIASTCLFGGIALIVILSSMPQNNKLLNRWPLLVSRFYSFQESMKIFRTQKMWNILFLSLIIWMLEVTSTWGILMSLGVLFNIYEMFLLVGVVSLSTLLPSPPGYLGTMQYAFSLVLSIVGYSSVQGVVAATAMQVFLLGSITVTGIIILWYSQLFSYAQKKENYRNINVRKA